VGSAADVLRIAGAEVGYVEGPNNWSKYAVGGAQNQPWCGSFVDWVLRQAGVRGEPSSVWTPSGLQGHRQRGTAIDRNGPVQPGDVVFFDWQGSTNSAAVDHVGFVTGVRRDGQVETIEGNTSPTSQGSQSNGGGVYRRVRPRSVIAGFGRPRYDNTPAPAPQPPTNPAEAAAFRRYAAAINIRDLTKAGTLKQGQRGAGVLALQRSLNLAAGKGIAEDGDFGPATASAVRDLQRLFKLAQDGVVGPQTKGVLTFLLGRIERGEA
jgi:hypothetical protein